MRETTDAIANTVAELGLELGELRQAISKEYEEVANNPERGFHFHTGRPLTRILGYKEEWLEGIPESSIESFAGTGNPFSLGEIRPGERVIDIGCGAGIDSLIAAKKVGSDGKVIGIDMTEAMLDKARQACEEAGFRQVEFRYGHAENLPVPDGWADLVISNGVLNLTSDKKATFREMARALNPKGRLQIGDILVQKKVPDSAKRKIDLWTG
jgi:SAM-dependent methyltransferase